MTLPFGITGSLTPTFVPARDVSLAVKLPFAFALDGWFPISLREPLHASVTFWEATAPVKLPTWHGPCAGSRPQVRMPRRRGWYSKGDSAGAGAPASRSPTYPLHGAPAANAKLQ